jgi:hypothetical protein
LDGSTGGTGDEVVGEPVGDVVGDEVVGEPVGEVVGDEVVGEPVGEVVGDEVVGESVGEVVGELVVGEPVGAGVGAFVGLADGATVLHSQHKPQNSCSSVVEKSCGSVYSVHLAAAMKFQFMP